MHRIIVSIFFVVVLLLCEYVNAETVIPSIPTGEPQLFVDDVLIAQKTGVVRHAHACEKLAQPVLEPETAWEVDGDDQRVYIYGTVLRDEETGQFRMWYNRLDLVLYATSDDGIHWERPELGLYEWEGSKANNIVLDEFHSPSVVYNPDAAPEERYAMLGCGKRSGRGYYVAHSPDGIHWERYPKNPVLPAADTCTLAFDANTGEYLALHKRNVKHRGYERRTVYLAASRDLQEWTEPKLVMAPEAIDDAQVKEEGGRFAQFYNMTCFPYGGQFLGMVTHFRYSGPPERKGPLQSGHDGPIDVQLVHSRDGRAWERCEDRSPVIPNGPYAYDAGCILGVANMPVIVNDDVWLYYTAITTTHGGFTPGKRISIALAKWRRDGFVSLDAGEEEGVIQTVPLDICGNKLTINADVKGTLSVAVFDAAGKPLTGYEHQDCKVVTGNAIKHKVAWHEQETLPDKQPVVLEIRMTDTNLYSFTSW